MEAGTNEAPQASYQVISFPAPKLPAQYLNMILSQWMHSLRYGNDYFKLAESRSYYWAYQRFIEMLLKKPDAIVRLAVLSDDHDVVLGWSLAQEEKLHYVWVQREQRNKGIATALIPKPISRITHITKAGMGLWNKRLPKAVFNPF
jgi:GNAT superfamily N-acetyltransferase